MHLSGLPSYSEAPKQPPVEAETGSSPSVSLRRPFEEFPFRGFLLALFALGKWYIGLVSGSHSSCVWVLHVNYSEFDFSGDSAVTRAQCFAGQWIRVLHQCVALLHKFCTFSTVKWTRILRFSVSVLTQNGEGCPADASALSLGMRARIWNFGNYFFEVHVAGSGDDGGSVRRHWPM